MKRFLIPFLALAFVLGSFELTAPVASACPMCKTANESESDDLPRAYMLSILFMLAMPATIFTGLGFSLYRMTKRETGDMETGNEQEPNDLNL